MNSNKEKKIKILIFSSILLIIILFFICFISIFWATKITHETFFPLVDQNESFSSGNTEISELKEGRRNPPPLVLKEELSVEEQIRKIAKEHGFKKEELLLRIAFCESSYDFLAVNYNKNGSIDRGVFQWNDRWHPEVSDECAFNVECATREAIRVIKERGFKEWTCGKILKY